jgi:hypothetical protein
MLRAGRAAGVLVLVAAVAAAGLWLVGRQQAGRDRPSTGQRQAPGSGRSGQRVALCAAVPRATLARYVDTAAPIPQLAPAQGSNGCRWLAAYQRPSGSLLHRRELTFQLDAPPGGSGGAATWLQDELRRLRSQPATTTAPLSGLGDEAALVVGLTRYGTGSADWREAHLLLRKGGVVVTVTYGGADLGPGVPNRIGRAAALAEVEGAVRTLAATLLAALPDLAAALPPAPAPPVAGGVVRRDLPPNACKLLSAATVRVMVRHPETVQAPGAETECRWAPDSFRFVPDPIQPELTLTPHLVPPGGSPADVQAQAREEMDADLSVELKNQLAHVEHWRALAGVGDEAYLLGGYETDLVGQYGTGSVQRSASQVAVIARSGNVVVTLVYRVKRLLPGRFSDNGSAPVPLPPLEGAVGTAAKEALQALRSTA